VKTQVKQDKVTGSWLAVMSNDYFGYASVYKFATKIEAQLFVDDEIAYRKQIMSDVTSIHDYLNTDQATSLRNKVAK